MNQKRFCDFCGDRQLQRSIVYGDAQKFFSNCYFGIGVYWQAIDFLINQILISRTELQLMQKDIVFGGQPIDSDDIWFDFGPIRYFTKNQIKKIRETLARISSEEITSSYSQNLFVEHEIHPDNWWVEDRADLVDQLKYYFLNLRAFMEDAIRCDQIIILNPANQP